MGLVCELLVLLFLGNPRLSFPAACLVDFLFGDELGIAGLNSTSGHRLRA